MVDTTGDIPERDAVKPDSKGDIVEDILESGEVEVTLTSGETFELHEHDTYVFGSGNVAVIYTKDDDDDVWFYAKQVTSVRRHY